MKFSRKSNLLQVGPSHEGNPTLSSERSAHGSAGANSCVPPPPKGKSVSFSKIDSDFRFALRNFDCEERNSHIKIVSFEPRSQNESPEDISNIVLPTAPASRMSQQHLAAEALRPCQTLSAKGAVAVTVPTSYRVQIVPRLPEVSRPRDSVRKVKNALQKRFFSPLVEVDSHIPTWEKIVSKAPEPRVLDPLETLEQSEFVPLPLTALNPSLRLAQVAKLCTPEDHHSQTGVPPQCPMMSSQNESKVSVAPCGLPQESTPVVTPVAPVTPVTPVASATPDGFTKVVKKARGQKKTPALQKAKSSPALRPSPPSPKKKKEKRAAVEMQQAISAATVYDPIRLQTLEDVRKAAAAEVCNKALRREETFAGVSKKNAVSDGKQTVSQPAKPKETRVPIPSEEALSKLSWAVKRKVYKDFPVTPFKECKTRNQRIARTQEVEARNKALNALLEKLPAKAKAVSKTSKLFVPVTSTPVSMTGAATFEGWRHSFLDGYGSNTTAQFFGYVYVPYVPKAPEGAKIERLARPSKLSAWDASQGKEVFPAKISKVVVESVKTSTAAVKKVKWLSPIKGSTGPLSTDGEVLPPYPVVEELDPDLQVWDLIPPPPEDCIGDARPDVISLPLPGSAELASVEAAPREECVSKHPHADTILSLLEELSDSDSESEESLPKEFFWVPLPASPKEATGSTTAIVQPPSV
jgi:hypothetical protein